MTKRKRHKAKKPGLPPGSLIYVGEQKLCEIDITVFDYDENVCEEKQVKTVEEAYPFRDNQHVSWINIDGLHDVSTIEKIGAHYKIHTLVLEDILHTNQRPKVDDHDSYLYIVLRMLEFDAEKNHITSEQISFILTNNTVISFQENKGDVLDPVRERIRQAKGRIRKLGADYLAYALLDAIVDHYFVVLEKMGERIEELEDSILESPTAEVAKVIHQLKREMILVRKSIWPLREVIGSLHRIETDLIRDSTEIFLKDLYDHTVQIIDSVESFRDILSGMLEIYLASVSNRMNEVMKVLTIISTIFIPLTFIAGVYGMNFKFMPELEWEYGYPIVMGIMVIMAVLMLKAFRRQHWI